MSILRDGLRPIFSSQEHKKRAILTNKVSFKDITE